MDKECYKHPEDFDGYSPREFADKFVKTNYFYQERVFEELVDRYNKEAKGDRERPSKKDSSKKRIQLAFGLERIAEAIKDPVLDSMKDVVKSCRNYLANPFER